MDFRVTEQSGSNIAVNQSPGLGENKESSSLCFRLYKLSRAEHEFILEKFLYIRTFGHGALVVLCLYVSIAYLLGP